MQAGWALVRLGCAALVLAGCASVPEQPSGAPSKEITAFSRAQPNGTLPGGWRPWRLSCRTGADGTCSGRKR